MATSHMRVAILSDIHGNITALNEVLIDINQQGGVDEYWVLGDLVALGPDPISVLECLCNLPHTTIIRGNTDRYVAKGDRPGPTTEDAIKNLELLPILVEVSSTLSWTQGAIAVSGWNDWLSSLPLDTRVTLPDGTVFLGVHASPGCDDGKGIHPGLNENDIVKLVADDPANLICVGHTHYPMELSICKKRIINIGSISNPIPPDLRASYVLLEATERGYKTNIRRVDYDHQIVIDKLRRINHPGTNFITRHMRGLVKPNWMMEAITY